MKGEKAPGAEIAEGTAPACDLKKPQARCGLVSGCSPAHLTVAFLDLSWQKKNVAIVCNWGQAHPVSFPFFPNKLLW